MNSIYRINYRDTLENRKKLFVYGITPQNALNRAVEHLDCREQDYTITSVREHDMEII